VQPYVRKSWFHRRRGALLLAVAAFLISSSLAADVVYLKNNEALIGRITAQTREAVTLRLDNGAVRTIPKTAIARISYSAEETARLRAERAAEEKRREDEARKRAEANTRPDATEPAGPSESITPLGALWRSAVLPGWGHYALGETWTAAGHASLNALALGYVLVSRNAALAAESQHQSQVTTNFLLAFGPEQVGVESRLGLNVILNQNSFAPYQEKVDAHNRSWYFLAAAYLFQLGHAYWSASSAANAAVPPSAAPGTAFAWNLGVRSVPAANESASARRPAFENYAEGALLYRF
jgi:hypothetical protein